MSLVSSTTVASPLRLYLFGTFRIEHEAQLLHLPTHKVESLLAYLALYPEPHAREKLAALFWGDVPDEQARGSLRKALTLLRQPLGADIVLADRQTVQLNPDYPLWIDAHEFQKISDSVPYGYFGMQSADLDSEAALRHLQAAIALYQGDLLADFYDDWLWPLREQYRSMYLETLLHLTQEMRTHSEYERAIEFAHKVLAADPANERAHQHLMFCYLASGNRSAALKQYEACERLLAQELAVEPMPETTALYRWLKQAPITRSATEALITNLPLPVSSFIGREREMAAVKRLLTADGRPQTADGGQRSAVGGPPSSFRLITLTGPGGSGKTRLAIQTATDLIDAFPDGVWWVELAPLLAGAHVPQAMAKTLGVRESPDEPLTATLTAFLRPRHLLLVLDNCEHLITACASLVYELLSQCPQLKILATSREALGITGEHIFPVPTLAVPGRTALSLADFLMQFEGIRLFIERAQAVQPSFALTGQNAPFVAHICVRLDGIPLALELAATRVKTLSVEDIAARLDDRFNLLTLGSRVAPPRHQTLRAVLDWSYDLLLEAERVLFRRLSVFAGGFTLEAAEAICAGEQGSGGAEEISPLLPRPCAKPPVGAAPLLDLLSRLVDKSLVVVTLQGEKARYTMLETIREFAREKLRAAGEETRVRERHFDYIFGMAEQAKIFGPEKLIWLNRLEAELDNIRAALAWSLEADPAGRLPPLAKRAERAIHLLAPLADFYFYRGYSIEAREWLDKLLAVDLPPSPTRARGFQKAGFLTRVSGDFEKAVGLLNQALTMAREINDKGRVAMSLLDLGIAARDHGNFAQVIPYMSEALSLLQEVGDSQGIVNAIYLLAETYTQNRDLEAAKPLWEQGLHLSREEDDKSHMAWGLEGLGDVAFLERQLEQAAVLHQESLKYKSEVMDKLGIAYSFEGLAQVAAAQQQPERAAVLWGAAEQLRQILNIPLEPSRRSIYTSLIPTARDQLGAEAFAAAWARGGALPLEQAIAFALGNP